MFDKRITNSFLYALQKGCTRLALEVLVLREENEKLKSRISELNRENEKQAENNYSLYEGMDSMLRVYIVLLYLNLSAIYVYTKQS